MRRFWMWSYILFFRNWSEFLGGGILRAIAVKHFCTHCGTKPSIGTGARIHKNTIIGNHSGIGRDCEIMNGVTIGNGVMMGPGVYVCTEGHQFSDLDTPMYQQGMKPIREIKIEDNVWIGAQCMILPGVTIGCGSVIGAGSVIRENIPKNSIVIGNPGVVVGQRKTKEKKCIY